jgi:CheY-like chemotaxis protein
LATVLVIDDNAAVRATIEIVLRREGHDTVLAADGRKGIQLFQAGRFDLLIVDIFMPDMDGLETISLVHKQQSGIPILVISGYHSGVGPTPDFLNMATKLGAVYSLQKPFRPTDLSKAVATCLGGATTVASASRAADGKPSSKS